MTSFAQFFGGREVKFNLVSQPRFWRHGVIIGESATHLFFEDKYEGQVSIPLHDIKEILPNKKDKPVKRIDTGG